ncbi:MAG TPA: polymer-forming cytoskeletal protein [Kiritimatiellia bacterium]|nr:polymer-forming cytoskeletal protein [Kiritimatiellia bacterium]HMP34966.1 polymer-forming cytoskeletal protein [Kiritimatiellia bacterium]
MTSSRLLPATLLLCCAVLSAPAALPIATSTNQWELGPMDTIDSVAFVIAPDIAVRGRTHDDSFWLAQGRALLDGDFGNDAWALAMTAHLGGTFRDHARVAAQTITVDGVVSNGLWALGGSVAVATNAHLGGAQFIVADQVSLLGHIEGPVYARGRSVTLGGTIIGSVHLIGDDIVIRPGTTIIGDLHYITTNRSIVLDANSQVSGNLRHLPAPPVSARDPATELVFATFFFVAALLVGIPWILAFPNLTGHAVRNLRFSLWRCGLLGIALLFGAPMLLLAIALTVLGLPLAAVLASFYGLVIYLGKFFTALAIGSALLQKRGQISLAGALLSLVTGLFLYYSMAFIPVIGASLQATATAFGAGALVLAVWSGRGRVGVKPETVGSTG